MIVYKKKTEKNELVAIPGDGTGRGSHWQRVVGTDSGGAASHTPCVRGGAAVMGHLMGSSKSLLNSIVVTFYNHGSMYRKVRFRQTHNQGLRQLLLMVSWDLRA